MRVNRSLNVKVIKHTLGEILKSEVEMTCHPWQATEQWLYREFCHADDKRFQGCKAL